jgi:hypothetical protein
LTITSGNLSGTISFTLPNLYDNEIIRVELSPSAGGSGILTNASFNIVPLTGAQSVSPTLTILEPILPPNFYNSSCNAIINNATENRFSLDHLKVDYPYVSITAQNAQAIINGSAVRAQVQDSNYTSLRHINPRYNGSRLIGAQLNEYTSGDISYGKTAVIEQNQKYFGYFDWVGAFEPELKGATAAHVIYLIDAQGNAIPTREDFDKGRYYDLVYNFERDKNALISLKVPEEVPSLKTMNGLKRVLYSGADITPIVHTDGGVNYGTVGSSVIRVKFTFNFGQTYNSNTQTYIPSNTGGLTVRAIAITNVSSPNIAFPNDLNDPNKVLAYQVLTSFSSGASFTLSTIGDLNLGQKIHAFIWFDNTPPLNTNTYKVEYEIGNNTNIIINGVGAGVASGNILETYDNTSIDPYNGWYQPQSNNYRENYYLIKSDFINISEINQPPSLTFTEPSLNIINSVSYPFWTSTGSNYIESSGSLLNLSTLNSLASINYFNSIPFPLFNVGSTSFIQTNPTRDQTGYDEVTTPFTIEIGDQFRFGYDEDNMYTVVSQSFSFLELVVSVTVYSLTKIYQHQD